MTIVTRYRPEPVAPPVARLRSRRGMHVEISGDGPPMIFVNGLFQSIDAWQGVQRLLPSTVMSVGFDMVNQGLSDSATDIVTFDDYCRVIAELIDELAIDITAATLVGFSAGADIIRSLVCRGRLSPRHIVLGAVSTPGFQSYWRQWFNNLARVGDTGDVDMLVRVIAFHMCSPGFIENNPRILDVMSLRYRQYYGRRPECLARLARAQIGRAEAGGAMPCPVDMIVPTHDSLIPAEAAMAYAASIDARVHRIDCGHTFAVEAPQATATVLTSILRGASVAN